MMRTIHFVTKWYHDEFLLVKPCFDMITSSIVVIVPKQWY